MTMKATTDNETTNGDTGDAYAISAETCKRVCKHMNEDHGETVYAMAKRSLQLQQQDPSSSASASTTITDTRLISLDLRKCSIQVVTCSGDVCERRVVEYAFEPPLQSSGQLRTRFKEIHDTVCSPQLHWLVSKPLSLLILITTMAMAYGTYKGGAPFVQECVEEYLPSLLPTVVTWTIAQLVAPSLYFTVVAHTIEAVWTFAKARSVLKLSWQSSLLWSALIQVVGYPIFTEFVDLVNHVKKQQNSNNNKSM